MLTSFENLNTQNQTDSLQVKRSQFTQDSLTKLNVPKVEFSAERQDSLLRIAEQKRIQRKKYEALKAKQRKTYREKLQKQKVREDSIQKAKQDSVKQVIVVKPQTKQLRLESVIVDSTKLGSGKKIQTMGNKSAFTADWMIGLFVVMLGVIAWARLFNQKYFTAILSAAVDYQNSFKLFRDKNAVLQRVSFALNMLAILSLALFSYFVMANFIPESDFLSPLVIYLILCGGIGVLMLWKQFFSGIMGVILNLPKEFAEYAHNVFIYYKIMGIILIPISLLLAYAGNELESILIWVGSILLGLTFLLRYGRSFRVFMQKGISIVYLILYFCSLEILPIVLIIKAIKTLV